MGSRSEKLDYEQLRPHFNVDHLSGTISCFARDARRRIYLRMELSWYGAQLPRVIIDVALTF